MFYLDGLHKDHLEVFTGSSSKIKHVRCVLMLDGTVWVEKMAKAIAQSRKLKLG
jgi:hypothetical protein